MRRLSFVPFFAVLLSAPGAAAQGWYFEVGELASLPVHGTPATGFRSSVAGHLTGFHANDAVVLAGGTAVLVTAPGVHQSAVALPLPAMVPVGFAPHDVRDLAIVRRGGEDGRDALVMVTGTGLWRWYMGTEFVSSPSGSPVPTWAARIEPLGSTVWAGAPRLRVADVDGDDVPDVLGVMANNRTIRCLSRGPGGVGWVIDTGARVRDFVVADVVAGGLPEIAVVTGSIVVPGNPPQVTFAGGVLVFAPGVQQPLAAAVLPNASAAITALADAGVVGLAVAATDGAQHELHSFAFGPGGLAACDAIALPDAPTAITAGCWRRPQEEDLLVTCRTVSVPFEVRHLGGLQLGAVAALPLATTVVADNRAVPLLADFYSDPDATDPALGCAKRLLYPMESSGEILLQRCTSFDQRFVRVIPSTTGIGLAEPPVAALVEPHDPSPYPSHIEVEMWQVGGDPLVYAAATAVPALVEVSQGVSTWDVLLSIPNYVPDTGWVMAVRYVQLDAAGAVAVRWPMRTAAVSFSPRVTLALLAAAGGQQPAVVPTGIVNLCGPTILCGITGDVVQPPSAPVDDDPPNPGK